MLVALVFAAAIQHLPVAEQNRRMAAYTALPIAPCETAMTPREAVWTAAEAEGRPVAGCFELPIAAIGRDNGDTYLNTERDYRDQRNVSVRIRADAARRLGERIGGAALGDALVGRRIVVRGRVVRQRIIMLSGGAPTGKYYYQTHVLVSDVAQIARPVPPPF